MSSFAEDGVIEILIPAAAEEVNWSSDEWLLTIMQLVADARMEIVEADPDLAGKDVRISLWFQGLPSP